MDDKQTDSYEARFAVCINAVVNTPEGLELLIGLLDPVPVSAPLSREKAAVRGWQMNVLNDIRALAPDTYLRLVNAAAKRNTQFGDDN